MRRWLPLAIALLAPPASAQTDADIYAAIDAFRPIAENLVIDGAPGDWIGLPAQPDALELPGDPARDIVSVAIAPLEQELALIAELAGTPLSAAGTYGLFIDFARGPRQEVVITLDAGTGVHGLVVFDDLGNVVSSTTLTGLLVALGAAHVEVSVPYAAIAPSLPPTLAAALDPANHRSWVRASLVSFTAPTVQADLGAPLASYRLLSTPYPLDPPLPAGLPNASGPAIELEFPLLGQWALLQGADGAFSHGGDWAWDWMQVDAEFSTSDPPESLLNTDYFAFGQTLLAPAAGTVTVATGGNPDNVPGSPGSGSNNNEIRIDLGAGLAARMFHQRQGTTLVSPSDVVAVDDPLAEVGNSGFSTQPHLHLDVIGGGSHRVAHPDVLVSLNPGGADPWGRRVASWEPRVGFLVERAPVVVPAWGPLAPLAGAIGIALSARRRLRARRD